MKPPQKELVADGNRQKPPRSKSVPSTTSSDALTILGDNDISTSASESYPQEESSSDEGNSLSLKNPSRVVIVERILMNFTITS